MVSEYNKSESEKYGVKNLMQVVAKRLTIRGFIVGDKNMGPVYAKERDENVAKWLKDGSFKAKMSVTDGIDNAPEGFVGMLQGKNFGKAVLKIADLKEVGFMPRDFTTFVLTFLSVTFWQTSILQSCRTCKQVSSIVEIGILKVNHSSIKSDLSS
jgi:hypothetical protein